MNGTISSRTRSILRTSRVLRTTLGTAVVAAAGALTGCGGLASLVEPGEPDPVIVQTETLDAFGAARAGSFVFAPTPLAREAMASADFRDTFTSKDDIHTRFFLKDSIHNAMANAGFRMGNWDQFVYIEGAIGGVGGLLYAFDIPADQGRTILSFRSTPPIFTMPDRDAWTAFADGLTAANPRAQGPVDLPPGFGFAVYLWPQVRDGVNMVDVDARAIGKAEQWKQRRPRDIAVDGLASGRFSLTIDATARKAFADGLKVLPAPRHSENAAIIGALGGALKARYPNFELITAVTQDSDWTANFGDHPTSPVSRSTRVLALVRVGPQEASAGGAREASVGEHFCRLVRGSVTQRATGRPGEYAKDMTYNKHVDYAMQPFPCEARSR